MSSLAVRRIRGIFPYARGLDKTKTKRRRMPKAAKFGHTPSVEAQLQQMDIRCRDRNQISPGHLRQLLPVNLTLFLQCLLAMSHLVDTSFTLIRTLSKLLPIATHHQGRILRATVYPLALPASPFLPIPVGSYLLHLLDGHGKLPKGFAWQLPVPIALC